MGEEDIFYLDGEAWRKGCVDLGREIKRSDLNMLSLGCLLDTKIETLSRELNTDVWESGKRYSWKHKYEIPECVKRYLEPQD